MNKPDVANWETRRKSVEEIIGSVKQHHNSGASQQEKLQHLFGLFPDNNCRNKLAMSANSG